MVKKPIPPIRNWSEYTPALIKRGALTAWFDDRALEKWKERPDGRRGRPRVYSDDAIQWALFPKSTAMVCPTAVSSKNLG